jgi:hypothetical protein
VIGKIEHKERSMHHDFWTTAKNERRLIELMEGVILITHGSFIK